MKKFIMKQDENRNPIPVLSIGVAADVTNGTYTCVDEVIRITAITESRVWYRTTTKTGSGLFLPAGSSLDVSTKAGNVIEVTGSINISTYL